MGLDLLIIFIFVFFIINILACYNDILTLVRTESTFSKKMKVDSPTPGSLLSYTINVECHRDQGS